MNSRKGFSLVEAMVVVVLMVLIMSSVYMMIMYYRDVSGTEQARVRQTQESRFLLSIFSSELKNAGAVMTLVNTGGFLATPPYFNGIYPLNNTNFPDGVIMASGDPNAVSKLTDARDPSSSNVLPVNNTIATPAWAIGDLGIVIGPEGFYVFSVQSLTAASITMEATPVYYSGLLNTAHYDDPETVMGNAVEYPVNAPVMRLADFSIYLIEEHNDPEKGRNVRNLVRISDCNGIAGVLENNDPVNGPVKGVIAENVWDLQLVYTAYPAFPDVTTRDDYFTAGAPGTLADLLTALRVKTFKEIRVNVVALTDDYPGQGTITYPLPLLADRPATTLPAGKFSYKTYSFLIEPRNFNIKI
ncbi:MAG: prepilin-type N-terminal cleavage/methylation domain-containing protein [Candidatus Aminicenantes bacterium]|nr:prepilin-type N-terminal cleavage/methylation domain-containing protein [Candidatus Aminicenantes bacterium]